MSLLEDRAKAMNRLESAVKNLLRAYDFGGAVKTPKYIRLCKKRAIHAKKELYKIEKELCEISNHAMLPEIELLATFMCIFKPELKKDIENIITFT